MWARGKSFFHLGAAFPRDSSGDGAWSDCTRSSRHSASFWWSFRETSRCLRDRAIKAVGKYLVATVSFSCSHSAPPTWRPDYLSRHAVGCCGRLVFYQLGHYLQLRAHLYLPGPRRFWHLLPDLLRSHSFATMPTVVHIPPAVLTA